MPRAPLDRSQLCDIYVDESSQTKHRFLTMGGLILPTLHSDAFDAAIWTAGGNDLPAGEMAWTKVSRTKLPAYKRVVQEFFTRTSMKEIFPLHFHMLVIDTSIIDDRLFNAGSRDTGFNKEIYQIGMKFSRLYGNKLFHLYLDRRSTRNQPEELRTILNRGVRSKNPNRDWPFRRAHFRDSDKCQKLQVVDILLGAATFHINGHRQVSGASPAKCELSDFVIALANIRDVKRDTPTSGQFTIWHRQLKTKSGVVPRP